MPWRAVPVMPVEIMLLPRWFPFHLCKVSYWSRTVIAPLLILMALKPKARNPRGIGIRELFVTDPEQETGYMVNPTGKLLGYLLIQFDKLLRILEPYFPKRTRARAIKAAVDFVTRRLNGEDGLGAIYPAMANAVMAFDALGYDRDDPDYRTAMASIEKLTVRLKDRNYCQPCLSPIWDTSLIAHALMEAGTPRDGAVIRKAASWMAERQILDVEGDWAFWLKYTLMSLPLSTLAKRFWSCAPAGQR